MKKVTKEVLRDTASRLMFTMKEEEYDTLLSDFDLIIKQMDLIANIKGVDEASPMTFPYEISTNYLRIDEVEAPLDIKDALKNAKDVKDNQIELPKVLNR